MHGLSRPNLGSIGLRFLGLASTHDDAKLCPGDSQTQSHTPQRRGGSPGLMLTQGIRSCMTDDEDDAAADEDDAIPLSGEFDNQSRRVHVPVFVAATPPSLPSDACRRPSDPGPQLPCGQPLAPAARYSRHRKYCIVPPYRRTSAGDPCCMLSVKRLK